MAKIILLSGGADSFISWLLFHPTFTPVFVHSGCRYSHLDLPLAARQARFMGEQLVQVQTAPLAEWEDGTVPHRNAILLATVANRLNADTICVSAPRGELIWDQQPAFHKAMQRALRGVQIVNPLRRYTKTQAVAKFLRTSSTGAADLHHTRSCYSPTLYRCGQCPACVKRWISMRCNGIHEDYTGDVAAYARTLRGLATWGAAWRYGLRPALEAARALW